MSHQVQIDYQGVAIQCQSVCEVAEKRLQELDEMLEKARESSTSLMNIQVSEAYQAIQKAREDLSNQIQDVRAEAQSKAAHRDASVAGSLTKAQRLQQTVNTLSSQKIIEFNSLLQMLLLDSIQSNYQKLLNQGNGVVTVDDALKQFLDGIEDETLRQFTYIAYLQNTSLRGEALLETGRALVGKTYEARLEEERSRIREELKAARVEASTIEEVTKASGGTAKEQIAAMQEAATTEIVGEKVRQKSLKIIMQAIKARGFVVDKNNIKIKRDTNEVIMVAQKASGEKAEFRVFLDGKFIYDFRGYEGQACQKDIGPFMKDLEEVYGVHVTKQTEIWSNPDKISTMKYQAINTNNNKA